MKNFIRRVFLATLLSLMTMNAIAQDNLIVIAQAIDLSGPNGSIGRDYVAGITTYFDSINASGGIGGKRIRFIVKDDQGVPDNAVRFVNEFIDREKVDFILGGIGANVTDAIVANPNFSQSKYVLFAPLIGSNRDYGSKVLFFRPSPEQELKYIFSYFDKLGIKSIGLAVQENGLNKDMVESVHAEIRKRGMQLSGIVKTDSNQAQLEKQASALAASNPGIVISLSDSLNTGIFLKHFRKFAPRTFVAGFSLNNLDTLAQIAGPKALEWTVFSQVVPNPKGNKIMVQLDHASMMKKYRDEDLSSLTFEGFLVAKTLVKALNQSRSKDAIQVYFSSKNSSDLGGIIVNKTDSKNYLSNFVDIALFRKGGGLLF